jgi:hypothetical protein
MTSSFGLTGLKNDLTWMFGGTFPESRVAPPTYGSDDEGEAAMESYSGCETTRR